MTHKTEEEIERRVEKAMDRLDKQFMKDFLTEKQYEQAVQQLNEWAEDQHTKILD